VMAKDGADWKIRKPLETRADYGSVEGLIGRMQTVQMNRSRRIRRRPRT
jgi:hypothetical protein